MKKLAWYKEKAGVFGPEYLQEYKKYLSPQRTTREVKFLIKILKPKKGAKFLDLACGHGRHAVALAKQGYHVTGVDINNFFLHYAEQNAEKQKVRLKLIKKDMRKIRFYREFDFAVNLFSAFGYFDMDADDQKVIMNVSRALKKGGKFVIDVVNRDRIIREFKPRQAQKINGGKVITMRKWDALKGANRETNIYEKKGKKKVVKNILVRLYSIPELLAMLKKAGMKFLKLYGDYRGKPYTFKSKRTIIVSQKM